MKSVVKPSYSSACLAVIGGSGFTRFPELEQCETRSIVTPYGPVASVAIGRLGPRTVVFLPRHGPEHTVPPHRINYRANIWALKQLNVPRILAINAVGGIGRNMSPGTIVIPHQIVDYTYDREQTYFDGSGDDVSADGQTASANEGFGDTAVSPVNHIDFTYPYDNSWRAELINHLHDKGQPVVDRAVYACTQGPRLETAAEILRLQRDGADIVGMTGMPEAALARELNIPYASVAVVVNWAAGISEQVITMEAIITVMNSAMANVKKAIICIVAALECAS